MRPVGEADGSVQVLMNHDIAARQRSSPVHPFNLQLQVLKADGVVSVHRRLKLQGEDQVQVLPGAREKRVTALRRHHLKATIERGDVMLPQKPIGRFQRGDPVQPQLLRQPSLPSSEGARCDPGPAASRPGSSPLPTRAEHVPLASSDEDRLCLPPWA